MDIYVGNLPYSAGDQELKELFEKHGAVSSARVVMDKFSGQSKGFGFVEMQDRTEALNAIKATNGIDFMGRALRVNESQPKPRDGAGGGRGGDRGGDRGGERRRSW
jgi:RNA recognition motif-containing protein